MQYDQMQKLQLLQFRKFIMDFMMPQFQQVQIFLKFMICKKFSNLSNKGKCQMWLDSLQTRQVEAEPQEGNKNRRGSPVLYLRNRSSCQSRKESKGIFYIKFKPRSSHSFFEFNFKLISPKLFLDEYGGLEIHLIFLAASLKPMLLFVKGDLFR